MGIAYFIFKNLLKQINNAHMIGMAFLLFFSSALYVRRSIEPISKFQLCNL